MEYRKIAAWIALVAHDAQRYSDPNRKLMLNTTDPAQAVRNGLALEQAKFVSHGEDGK